ncbi:unnamed protein product [Pedinophyceae sp. YPF-701]|nr:unnamed protein product [Pedinophyceae sp. YPF-701]
MASLVLGQQLEQVYSLLEASQWKTALKILDQIVAKKSFKGNAEVRVLRAIALQRLGRGSEALEICADIRKDKAILSDSNVLTLASNVYRWERRPAELGSMYEDACAANPGNMHLLQEAFRANMSAFNFVKQQQIAMKLNRGAPSDKHFWWVVMSVLLQARNAGMAARRDQAAPAGPGAQQLLKLADGMISKHLGRAASLSADQLLVAVHVLRAMDRPGDALDHLRSEVGRNALPLDHERIGLEAVLLEDCGDYPSAAASYLTLLDVDKDDFHAWLKYLDCMLPGGEPWRDVVQGGLDSLVSLSQADRRRSACDVSLEDAVAAVESAIARFEGGAEENNSGCRSVLLARTELAYRLHLMSEPGQRDGEQLANAMYAYFKGCSTVSSCASDLGRYCAEISSFPQAAQRLADRLEGDTKDPDLSGDMRQATNDLRARVCALRLRHELGCDGEDGDSLARHAHRLMDLYAAASPLSKDLDPRERGPAEDVALIAAGCLVDCYRPTVTDHANTGRLIQALLCLEAAIKKRPYSANLRIAAGSLMGILGSAEEAAKHFKRLDIKFIQNDSLAGHICLPTASSLSSLAEVQHLCRQEVALFDDHEGSAGDTLTIAYEHGTLSKVIEMVDFKERLEYSHARLVARQEGSISAISSIFTQSRHSPACLKKHGMDNAAS